jgi:thiamine-phosphate pyrophosphorylase
VRLFLVSDRTVRPSEPIVRLLGEAAAAGVDRVLVREKDLPDRARYELACAAIEACRPHGCRVYLSGRPDMVLASGADGVHLPALGLSVSQARALLGPKLEIGVSTHSLEEARFAQQAGADYVFLGPVFPTPGKGPTLGVEALAVAVRDLTIPVYAIGGIDKDTASEVAEIPLAGVALIRGILSEPDVPAAVGVLRERLSLVRFGVAEVEEDDPEEDEDDEDSDEENPGDQGWGVG